MDTAALALSKKALEKQGYRFIGDHSAVKVCDEKGYTSLIRRSKPRSLGIKAVT